MTKPKQDDAAKPVTNNNITPQVVFVTKEGLEKLRDELDFLKGVRRKEVAEHIKEAISYGDLSENAEYDAAKNEQAFLEGRILELESMIKHSKIITDTTKHSKIVQFGSIVKLQDIDKSTAEPEEYTLVGSTEADVFVGKISNESPLGHALLERTAGDVVEFQAPKGKIRYKILKVS
jgi:transcription elongation factor GreA